MEATRTEKENLPVTQAANQEQQQADNLETLRDRMKSFALLNPLEEVEHFDRRMDEFIRQLSFKSTVTAFVALAVLPESGERQLVWEARFAFHYLPKLNAKRTMYWTARDREIAEHHLEFFLKTCGSGKPVISSTNFYARARKPVTSDEFKRIFDND